MGQGFFSRVEQAASLRWRRAAWLATTGLTAVLLSPGALRAQSALPPNTTPQGGNVVGGSSSIAQSVGNTTITQTSQRTAIDWQSFNVGSAAKVQFVQPSSSAIALNRVVTPEPSIIAGKISANGQLVLINQSGVVFTKGSQVNAESIVVATSNIANADFMAGHLKFTGTPNPGAKIINDGQLTAGQAGLVGLVAPQVANNGVITAQLGQVVLAGASAFTLDLYGDRLISLDVTQAVRAVDIGGKILPALVTNRGLILADGGKITLTAQDADALVTQLINAGGTLRANTVGGNTGTISLQGVGGNISIAGNLLAQGTAAGAKGGAVAALTTGTLAVAPGAVIDASGAGGGGVVALGTDIGRAEAGRTDIAAPRAGYVEIAPKAVIKADATGSGNAGTVTLLSAKRTDFAGTISTQGGPQGGDGGLVEISSDGVISLGGTANAGAVAGKQGEVMLDPATLVVANGGTGTSTGTTTFGNDSLAGSSTISPFDLQLLGGTIVLEASKLIDVEDAVNLTYASGITLASLGDISVNAQISLGGSLEINADGSIAIDAGLTAGGISVLDTGTGLVTIDAPVTGSSYVELQSGGGITETSTGLISTPLLQSSALNAGNDLLSGANTITQLGTFTAGAGDLTLDDAGIGAVTISGPVSAHSVLLSADTLDLAGNLTATDLLTLEIGTGGASETAGTLVGTVTAGTLTSGSTTIGGNLDFEGSNTIATLGNFNIGNGDELILEDSGKLNIAGTVTAGFVNLSANTLAISGPLSIANELELDAGAGGVTENSGGSFIATGLTSGFQTIGGNVSLGNDNSFQQLTNFAASGNILINDTGALDIRGLVSTPGELSLGAGGALTEFPGLQEEGRGLIDAATFASIGTIGGTVSLGNDNSIATLAAFGASGSILFNDDGSLDISGLVSAPAGLTLEDPGGTDANDNPTPGDITELAGGTIAASELDSGGSTIAGTVDLGQTSNKIARLQDFTVGTGDDFTLKDGSSLNVGGTIQADSATLEAATLDLSGLVSVSNVLALESGPGGIFESGTGSLSTTTLSSGGTTIGGTVSLGGANSITDLNNFAATGDILLNDAGPFANEGEALTIDGIVQTPSRLSLEVAGSLVELAGGTISVGALTSIGTIGGEASLGNANTIKTLGAFAVTDNILLDNTGTMSIAGLVSAPGGLTLEGNSDFTELAGGRIAASELDSGGTTIIGNVELGQSLNTIGTLDNFTVGGSNDLTLLDSGSLDVEGPVSAGSATLGAPTLGLFGPLSIGNVLALEAGSGGIAEFGGINAGTLTSGGTTIGSEVSLANGISIATLGSFAATGNILLDNNGPLDIDGLVSAPAGLTLEDTAGITEIPGGTIAASELDSGGTTIGGNVELANANAVQTLDDFTVGSADNFTLKDGGSLNVAGTLVADSATLQAATLGLGGLLSITNELALEAGSGGITETGFGSFDATTLSSGGTTIGGTVSLGNANSFADLNGFAAKGDILLNDSFPFAGESDALTIDGIVATPGELRLGVGGPLTELAGGTIAVGTLASFGTIEGGVSLGNANAIGTLGAFAASGDILLNNAGTLNIGGLVSAPDGLSLEGGSNITEVAGGTLVTPELDSNGTTIGGNVSFGNLNSINTLAGLAADGGILLNNGLVLQITGAVSTPGLLTLQDSANVTEATGGVLDAGTLSTGGSAIDGNATLRNANAIGTLGGFTITGNLALNDPGTLIVGGSVIAPFATIDAGSIAVESFMSSSGILLLASNTGIDITGFIDAGRLGLQASHGNVTETGGSISTGLLGTNGGSISGNAVLNGGNTISQIGSFTAVGDLILRNSGGLGVIAKVQASNVTLADSGTVSVGSSLVATAGQLTLAVDGLVADGGTLVAPAGTIAISPFTAGAPVDLGGSAAGGLELSGSLIGALDRSATVSIASTGSILSEGAITFANPLLVFTAGGAFTQTGILNARDADISGSNLTFDGNLTATSLDLATTGNITQAGSAVLAVNTLASTGLIGGSVALAGTANAIATLTAFTAAEQFALNDASPLTVAGPINATDIGFVDSARSGIAVDSVLTAASGGTIGLQADAISADDATRLLAPGGTVAITPFTAGTEVDLGGTATGLDLSATLLSAVGGSTSLLDIATAGSIAADGNVTVNAGTLLLDGGGIGFGGVLTLPGAGVLELASTNGVTTAAGETLTAATLLAGSPLVGPVDMTAGTNIIGRLGAITVTGTDNDFALNDASALDVTSPITARNIGLGAAGLTVASAISASNQVSLTSSNGISERGEGVITALTLSTGGATVSGPVQLQAANNISSLSNFLASGDLTLNDIPGLTLGGNVSAANINLTAAGLDFDGDVTTGLLALTSSAPVGQTGGTISATELTSNDGTIAGAAVFGAAGNAIGTLGPFAATGDLAVGDDVLLTVAGPVTAPNIALSAAGIDLDGGLTTGTLQLDSSAGITEGVSAALNAAQLTTGNGSVTGDTVLNNPGANQIGGIGDFTATGGLTLNDAGALGINGLVSLGGGLALLDANGVTQSGGTITAAALTSDGGTIGGNALFGSSGNEIASLGDFAATGNILLADAGALNLTGNVSAATGLTLNVAGAIGQSAGIITTPLFDADPTSITLLDANQIALLGNVIASGDVDIAGVGEIGQLSAADATISSPGNLLLSGAARISGNFTGTAAGQFSQTGALIAGSASLSAGNIALGGSQQIGNSFAASTGGNFLQSGSLAAADAVISAGTITLAGDSNISGQLDLISDTNVLHTSGSLDAGTLTGSGDQLALFSAPTDIGTLGSFLLQDSLFSLSNTGDLTVTGPVRASAISLSVAGTLTLVGGPDGGLFIKGSVAPDNTTTPRPGDSVITVTTGANGAPPAVVQTGTFLIDAGMNVQTILGSAAQAATLFLTTLPNGTINFAPYPDGLYAPTVDLIVGAGPLGVIDGNVVLKHLEISGAASTDLTGTINGVVGPAAAGEGSVNPFPQAVFRFNTCPIASTNCTILPTETVPSGSPLSGFDITSRKHKRLNRNVVLPGVAARDF